MNLQQFKLQRSLEQQASQTADPADLGITERFPTNWAGGKSGAGQDWKIDKYKPYEPPHDKNLQSGMCAQRRLRSAWASAQSDQSLRCPHEESLGP